MRLLATLSSFVAIAGAFAFACCAQERPAAQDELTELLTERRDVLKERYSILKDLRASASVGVASVIEAQTAYLEAELALEPMRDRRKVLFEEMLEAAKTLERLAEVLVESGQATTESVLAARAARLDVQIRMVKDR